MGSFAFYILIGFLTGIASGMGFGGGSILILILTSFLAFPQLKAGGINLLYFLPVALFALIFHFKNHSVDKKTAQIAILTGIIGAAIGAFLANHFISGLLLKKAFAMIVLLIGFIEIKHKER
jgi:uncharacterized membrane protein YfcA